MTTEVRMDNDALAAWLDIATRKLSTASAARVRKELQEHVESAREDASAAGAAGTDARRTALESLGNAKTVNRRYRRVLLTAWEARLLEGARRAGREPRLPIVTILLCFGTFSLYGAVVADHLLDVVQDTLGGVGLFALVAAPFLLPVQSRMGGRVFRYARWAWMIAMVLTMSRWETLIFTGVLFIVLGVPFEWGRMNVRRKLPTAEWPRTLYL